MELPNKVTTTEEKIQIAWLISIFVLIFVLIIAISLLYKNIELIKSSPVQYAIDTTPLESCTCTNSNGDSILFSENKLSFILDP